MKKGLMIGLALFAFAGTALAGLPCAAYSTCTVILNTPTACATTDLVWSPNGSMDTIVLAVTVLDCLENPVSSCDVRLEMSGQFDPANELGASGNNGAICGTQTVTQATDANGVTSFTLTGGGAGAMILDYTVTAECADPEVELCAGSDTLCVKSVDFNGTGNVNFFDTFKYLPQLNSTTGYTGDMAACAATNVVNFFDTFKYLPALNSVAACPSGSWTLTLNDGGIYECDDIY
ncbi:MAG: hypothetical protein JW958_11965 [Candidatus Eisenbacteria bacterium]|nr:hypothetical protein [Candidatus Eisenbacteria bacterium]